MNETKENSVDVAAPFCANCSSEECRPNLEEAEVLIQFGFQDLTKEQRDKLWKIESLFHELGIYFDTGGAIGGARDWEWDWSLRGPVKVFFKKFVKDDPKNRYYREENPPEEQPDSQDSQGEPTEEPSE